MALNHGILVRFQARQHIQNNLALVVGLFCIYAVQVLGIERERGRPACRSGRENGSFPVAEILQARASRKRKNIFDFMFRERNA